MKTTEIQKTEWPKFFDSLSRKHRGSSATLEILGGEIGAQVEEQDLAFEGIVAQSDEVRGYEVAILMGARSDDHITHSIRQVTQVSLGQTDDGADFALAIRSSEGVTALLRFRSSMSPETGDAGTVQPSLTL